MSGPLLCLADLAREPQFHLDELLDVLSHTPDGFTTLRQTVAVRDGQLEQGWEADANGYAVTILPDHICGFLEEGDGKVLTVITGRTTESKGGLTLSAYLKEFPTEQPTDHPYYSVVWQANVRLGEQLGNWEQHSRAYQQGLGECETPGVAALIAYLRAWGVLA